MCVGVSTLVRRQRETHNPPQIQAVVINHPQVVMCFGSCGGLMGRRPAQVCNRCVKWHTMIVSSHTITTGCKSVIAHHSWLCASTAVGHRRHLAAERSGVSTGSCLHGRAATAGCGNDGDTLIFHLNAISANTGALTSPQNIRAGTYVPRRSSFLPVWRQPR